MSRWIKRLSVVLIAVMGLSSCYSLEPISYPTSTEVRFAEPTESAVSQEGSHISSSETSSASSQISAFSASKAPVATKSSAVTTGSAPASKSASPESPEIPQPSATSTNTYLTSQQVTAEQVLATLNQYFAVDPAYKNQQKPYPILPSTLYNLKYNVYKNSGPFESFDFRIEVSSFTSFFMYIFYNQHLSVETRIAERQRMIDYIERQGKYLCTLYPGIKFNYSFYESNSSDSTTSSEASSAYRSMFRNKTYFTWVNYNPLSKITDDAYTATKAGDFRWYPVSDAVLDVKDGGVLIRSGDTVIWKPTL